MRNRPKSLKGALQELDETRARLAEADEHLRAFRGGEVDAIIAAGPDGREQVYTLQGADYTYRILVEHMNQAAVIVTEGGALLFCNEKFQRLTGIPSEQALSLPLESLFPEPHLYEFRQLVRRSRRGDAGGELLIRNARGRLIPVYASLNLVTLGTVPATCILLTDLTEQKQKEEIIAAGRLASAILEQMGEATVVCDPAGKVLRASRVTESLCRCDPVGQPFAKVFPLEIEAAGPFDLLAIPPGGRIAGTAQFRQPGNGEGRVVHVLMSAKNLVNEAGAHLGWVVTLADLTAQKEVEQELRRAQEAAESAARAKSEFLARMSHEIRTPMNGIMGMTELALMEERLPGRVREYLGLAKQSAIGLLSIINDILDLAKVEAGRVEVEAQAFELRAALGSVLSSLGVAARKKGLRLEHRLDPALPVFVVGDEGKIRQVLTNLVGNAVKFTARGDVEVSVSIAGEEEGSTARSRARLLFSVRDTGIGIASEDLRSVFDSFSQATRSTHAQFGGTGLGLSISKQLVELMGGRIWAESPAPEPSGRLKGCLAGEDRGAPGSIFHFTVEVGLTESGLPVTPSVAPTHSRLTTEQLRVLLAEDNPINQIFAQELLGLMGHVVTLAADGEEALRALSREKFDVVLMDVQMPNLGGEEAAKRIRAGLVEGCPRDVPIVALTAHAIQGDRERFMAAGMDEYLSKPFDPETLDEVLRRVAAGKT